MITIQTYPTQFEAAADKIALDAAGIPSIILGVGAALEGGIAGVQLQVPEAAVDDALKVLEQHTQS